MRERVLEKQGKKVILLGNEAIVRGALESGIGFASTYPGTPASEIGDTFARIAKQVGIYFEYSVNEKVALEVAAGAAFSGVKSIVAMKHFGLNVASDSLMPIAYVGASPMVIVIADDPNCWSSAQSEQDSRWYVRLAHIPMLEPSDPQEAKNFTKIAFDLSERFEIPVLMRITTRVSHMKGIVTFGKIIKGKTKGFFVKNLKKFYNLAPGIMKMHERLLGKIEKIRKFSEKSKTNRILNKNVKSSVGIITSGVSFNYVMDSLKELGLNIPILKLGLTYPLPEEKIKNFIRKFKSVLVVEELDPILEGEISKLAKEANPDLKILGKDILPKAGEYKIENIVYAISKLTNKKLRFNFDVHSKRVKELKIPRRFPVLCPGCPHRATFYAAKIASEKNTVFGGDIGCYMLGIFPPLKTQDFLLSMGASVGIIHGVKKVSDQKAISFIGDSTFFHAGMPGVLNMVFNKSNSLVIILDNRYTAMTGFQPHPGTGVTGTGEETTHVEIDNVVKGFGVKNMKVVDPFNLNEMIKTVKKFLNKKETSVIVAKRECQLMATRRKRKQGIPILKFEINQDKCKRCGTCLYQFGCPAIYRAEGGSFHIDENLCTGCSVCAQVCPNKSIQVKK